MDGHADIVAEFCSVTGAAPNVAESFLAASEWQLDNAVDLYFSEPANPSAAATTAAPMFPEHQVDEVQIAPSSTVPAGDYVEILDDEDDGMGAGDADIAELARQRASALAARQQAEAASEGELAIMGMPLAVRQQQSQLGQFGAAEDPLNMFADDDMAAVAAAMAAEGSSHEGYSNFHRQQQEELLSMYQRQAAHQQASAADGGGGLPSASGAPGAEEPAAAADTDAFNAANASSLQDDPVDLPEGINLEEARMLEAAMLGVPYAGRIPDFTQRSATAAPLSPGTLEQHAIRNEQDQAYEESLALDRAKQESLAAAAAAAEAAEQEQQRAQELAAAEAAQAAEALKQLLASKKARLPPEPDAQTPGSVQVMVRLPSGSRQGRRFLPSDPLQALFDFVDVESAAAAGEEGAGGSCGVRPGSYRLVSQFPRRVLTEDSTMSLQDAGISTDLALFIESL